MFGKKKRKPRADPVVGETLVAVTGAPLAQGRQVRVENSDAAVRATVRTSQWYDKVLILQGADPQSGEWSTVSFGLTAEQAGIIGAALLGLADPRAAVTDVPFD
jgi:hypothetical protein